MKTKKALSQDGPELRRKKSYKIGRREEDEAIEVEGADGVTRQLYGNAVPLVDSNNEVRGSIGVLVDITNLKQAQDKIAGLAAIVESSTDAIIGKTLEGTIVSWNHGAEALYGYSAKEAIGRAISLLAPPDHTGEIPIILEKIRRGETIAAYDTVRMRKDGSLVDVFLTVSPVRDSTGKIIGVSSVARDITERKKYEERIKLIEEEMRHMAHHDALTDLPNRRLFADLIKLECAQARRHRTRIALLFMDIDRFKEVNDTLGHDIGDRLLKEVAVRLKTTVRESDTVARTGGDEFNILLADFSKVEDAADITRKIIGAFRRSFSIAGHELHVTTSIGISVYPDDSDDIDTLFRFADIAMYHAKEQGRNTFQFYNPEINIRSIEKMKLEGMLRQSIDRGELVVYYQPKINVRTRQMMFAEALVRWNHPIRGVLEAKQFIPAAEDTGFITVIDEWVLRTACAQVRSWLDDGLPSACISVNLSAREFQNPELTKRISQILSDTGTPPECLDIEITESLAMSNIERTISRLKELSEMGVHASIDDFGTGYSSLNYLKRLPIETLKIDKSFVQDIATDSDDRAIIRAVTAMAHNMSIRVLAEGVETEDQLSFLRDTSCDEAQGYLFSKPLPAQELREFMAATR